MKANYEDARDVLKYLSKHKHQSFLAGGCVRDMLIGRPVNDFDITTSATPEEIEGILTAEGIKTIPVGASFGVVKAILNGGELDIATFRTDGVYSDNRRPDSVAYTKSAEEDVKRRDFTINGMLMDADERVIDHVGGQIDLKCRLIKTIGKPAERFGEDALRMMRAVRFAAKLGFDIDRETEQGIKSLADTIDNVSKERKTEELEKIFTSGRADLGFWLLNKLELWPEMFGGSPDKDDCWVAMYGLAEVRASDSFLLSLGTILAECYSHQRVNILGQLVLTNQQKSGLDRLLDRGEELSKFLRHDLPSKRKMMAWEDKDLVLRLVEINQRSGKMKWCLNSMQSVADVYTEMDAIIAMGWPGPLITGDDLIAWGWIQGAVFTELLNDIRNAQLNGQLLDKEQVRPYILSHFPAAPRRLPNGDIADGMRRVRYVAKCKHCPVVMSFTVKSFANGKIDWNSLEDKIGTNHISDLFAHCESCWTRKKKANFVKAAE